MALPAIAAVRRGAPAAVIAVAARPAIAPLFALVPGVDATVVLEGPATRPSRAASWRELGRLLASESFDVALLLPNSMRAALVAAAARIPERWGYRTEWRRGLLTRPVPVPSGVHQVEYYRSLVRALGFPSEDSEPRVIVDDAVKRRGIALLTSHGWSERTPLVAMAPGAAYGGAKRWPPERFGEVASAVGIDGAQVVIVGSGADTAVATAVSRASRTAQPMIDLVGKTDLSTLAGVLAVCRTLVTNDSGAMHLGAAVGLGVTALFGPTRDRETRPLGSRHDVLTYPVWCRPCMLRECPLDHRCLRGIAAATVVTSVRRHVQHA
jgi:heptosyltransferase-2